MPTVAEMQLLNSGLDELARTFLHNRVLQSQDEQEKARTELQRAMLGLRAQENAEAGASRREGLEAQKTHYQATREHEGRMEASQKAILDHQATQAAIKQLDDAYEQLQGRVNAGTMTPEQAQAQAKIIEDTVKAAPGLAWQNSRFGLVGTDFKKGQAGEFTEDPTTGERFFRPSGTHQTLRSGNRNPNVVWEVDPFTNELRMKRIASKGSDSSGVSDIMRELGGASETKPKAGEDPLADRLAEIEKQLKVEQTKIAGGNTGTGFLGHPETPLQTGPVGNNPSGRQSSVDALTAERAALQALSGRQSARPRVTSLQAPAAELQTSPGQLQPPPPGAAAADAAAPQLGAPPPPAAAAPGRVFTDKTGARWRYVGMGDPNQDRDPSSWQAVP